MWSTFQLSVGVFDFPSTLTKASLSSAFLPPFRVAVDTLVFVMLLIVPKCVPTTHSSAIVVL